MTRGRGRGAVGTAIGGMGAVAGGPSPGREQSRYVGVMRTAPGERLLCPKCAYELGAMREDEGVCPECGLGYHKRELRARRAALVSAGLAMIALGMGGVVLLDVLLTGAGAPGGSGDSEQVTATFRFMAAALLAAGGVVVVSRSTARTRWALWWPLAVAAAVSLVDLLNVAVRDGMRVGMPGGWLQSLWLSQYFWRASAIGMWFVAGAAALVVARVADELGLIGWRRLARIVGIVVVLGLAVQVARWWQATIRPMAYNPSSSSAAMAAVQRHNLNLTDTGYALAMGIIAFRSGAMLLVGFAAVVVRCVWRAGGGSRLGVGA